MINYNENEAKNENGSQRHDVKRIRPRHAHKYAKYKMCLSMMMVICNKQRLPASKYRLILAQNLCMKFMDFF